MKSEVKRSVSTDLFYCILEIKTCHFIRIASQNTSYILQWVNLVSMLQNYLCLRENSIYVIFKELDKCTNYTVWSITKLICTYC